MFNVICAVRCCYARAIVTRTPSLRENHRYAEPIVTRSWLGPRGHLKNGPVKQGNRLKNGPVNQLCLDWLGPNWDPAQCFCGSIHGTRLDSHVQNYWREKN